MRITQGKGQVQGTLVAPPGKSSMQRACAAALIAGGTTTLINPGRCNDDIAAMDVIQKLGAQITTNADGSLTITSKGVQPIASELNVGESGLGVRMFTPIAALSSQPLTINGMGSLLTRPMQFFDAILPQLNITTNTNAGKLPFQISGPLQPANISIDGSLSSQFLTGMLMAYAASGTKNAVITVKDLKSKPYIDLTLKVLQDFGYQVTHQHYEQFSFGQHQVLPQRSYTVEGDWSGAAFLLVAGATAGQLVITGLDSFSTQADKAILQALMDCGCQLSIEADRITVGKTNALKAFQFDATDCPDLFPPLVALAANCQGKTVIAGVGRLAHKESNRALTLQQEFGKLNVPITLQDDLMIVEGGGTIKGNTVHSHHDHRIAMACAVAALNAVGDVAIEEAEAINKSYPNFYEELAKVKQ
jgi:3-phosphoshikimate 1-carboxyvinyltransferase